MNQDTMSTINLCSTYTKLFHSFVHGKGEHETDIFATFTGKAVRRRGVTFMSTWCHTSIEANTK